MGEVTRERLQEFKIFIFSIFSSIAFLGNATIPTPDAVEKLTGGLANPLLRFIAKIRLSITDNGVFGFAILMGIWCLYRYNYSLRQKGGKYFSKTFLALSILLSCIMITGMSFKKYNSFAFSFQNKFQIIYSFILFWGFFIFFCTLFELLFRNIEGLSIISKDKNIFFSFLLDKHPLAGPFLLLLICWLPYWVAYFPGSAMWDAFRQFNYYFGIEKWSDHHPVFSTIVYGNLLQFGRKIGSDNTGIFFCALFQHILYGGSIAYGIYSLKKWNVAQNIRGWTLIFFALCPIVAFWPHSVMKDVAFDAFILTYFVLILDLIRQLKEEKVTIIRLAGVGLTGILASLMRHNGIYIVFLSLILLAFIKMLPKHRVSLISTAVLTLVCTSVISNALIEAVGAIKGSTGLALSVPFQQTARYVKEHGDEVTEEERMAIDGVLNYDYLAEHYDPDLSDPIKGTYKNDDSKLPAYIKVWFQMFFKHPMTYIEATLSNSYSYFYPNGESTTKPLIYNIITTDPRINTGYLDIHYVSVDGQLRNFLEEMLYVVKQIPGIGLICHMGTYTWILLILFALGVYKQKAYLVLGCIPAILNFLTCVASPVNGYLRYFLPNVLMIPILIGWFTADLMYKKERIKNET